MNVRPSFPAPAPPARALRQSMAWIHAWLGLLAGWILFAMFLTGTASYFRPEITQWMQPELRSTSVPAEQAAQAAIAHMQATTPNDQQWFIYLPDDRTAVTRVFARAKPNPEKPPARRPELKLDPATGQSLEARDTRGGEHFYRFHFQLQLPHPWGRWLAGVCAMFMLAAIISGVITHKRIFVDFFTLRWRKGQRSWLDAHNASAVLALPFHAMITYTGLITLVAMYMPWPVKANFDKPDAFTAAAYGAPAEAKATGTPAPLLPVGPMIQAAGRAWSGDAPRTVVIRNPGDTASTVTLLRATGGRLNARPDSITFSGATGQELSRSPSPGPAIATAGVMLGLHLGHFASPALRWVYFLLGLTGAAMVGTGLVLWVVKRRKPNAAPFFGLKLVERLNIGAIACLPSGMAAYLLANRLIPADLPGRAELEVKAMFWTWFGLAVVSLQRPARRAWIETLGLATLAFAALPVVNAATTDRGLVASLRTGDWLFAGFDLAMLAIAALCGLAAFKASRKPQPPSQKTSVRAPAAASPKPAPAKESVDAL
ncbi:PepSY-associated TM helix domain-containing protein [Caulobacter zeae]|nr:PepSY-associated TM helix domain-containing protein [Caulobacter zeae]